MRRKHATVRQTNGSDRFDLCNGDNFAIREFATIDTGAVRFQLKPITRRNSERPLPTDVDVIEMRERDMSHLVIHFESQTLCGYSDQLSAFAADAAVQVPIEHEHAIRRIMPGIQFLRRREIDLLQGSDFRLIASEQTRRCATDRKEGKKEGHLSTTVPCYPNPVSLRNYHFHARGKRCPLGELTALARRSYAQRLDARGSCSD